jgi:hypothetical protein
LQKAAGYRKTFYEFSPKSSPPNVVIGGPVRVSPGFPLKICGNDELGENEKSSFTEQAAEFNPVETKEENKPGENP